ncbi:hypothetical protein [Sporomusa sp.]|jgi:hypothetical protein|uniref:hypothetical protein n=1 Tax=Sporomusa sp. TaxID=2078658 RepID=UPI002CE94390|nr:hypothetical protein [Sporomusa sp.]MDF2875369.1 hypothetical protein [Sporomusa sp.]HWR08200.1 hypothetical protein [Sporomusa sp.]
MSLKVRIGLYLALIAGILTILVGAMSSVTPVVILYRTLVSVVLFAVLGYTSAQFAERYFRGKINETVPKGNNIDVVSLDEPLASEFKPLNPEHFENITLTQK